MNTWGRTHRCAGAGTRPRCAELGEQPRARTQCRARQSCGDAKHRHGREPSSLGPRRASPTHLLQKFGQIIHFLVQDHPGALAVVVFPDLFQGVVLDGLVRRLGHFGKRRPSGPADTSGAGRNRACTLNKPGRDHSRSRDRRREQGGRSHRGDGQRTASDDWPESVSLKWPALLRPTPKAPPPKVAVDWLQKMPSTIMTFGARGDGARRGFPCTCAESGAGAI